MTEERGILTENLIVIELHNNRTLQDEAVNF